METEHSDMTNVTRGTALSIPTNFILNGYRALMTGRFSYSIEGKIIKEFVPHVSDGLKLIENRDKPRLDLQLPS